MSLPKKQHFVPQTYLKHFSIKNKKVYMYFPKKTKNLSSRNKKYYSRKRFYTIEGLNDKYAWENFYAQDIEPILGALLDNICTKCENVLIQNGSSILSKSEKYQIIFHVKHQCLRDKQGQRYLREFYIKNCQKLFWKRGKIS